MLAETVSRLFNINNEVAFNVALNTVFQFQYTNNAIYRQWCNLNGVNESQLVTVATIPYLPISFFKTYAVVSTTFNAQQIFESSGTTGTINSKHYVKDIAVYQQSFNTAFKQFYGNATDYCVIGLLPSYLERNNSSLVFMVNELIEQSKHPSSGFYLNEFKKLKYLLLGLELSKQKTLLLGVTFALLDFAEQFPMPLYNTTIMETGGMKGRREEMTRAQVHEVLCKAFQKETIHSEYGMTELLSQAYSKGNGLFNCPPWMKVLIREEDDPFAIHKANSKITTGAINVIDLANIWSCSFIATEDAGKIFADESFEVQGRVDNSDVRGCNLLIS